MRWVVVAMMAAACGDNDPPTYDCTQPVQTLYTGKVWGENLAIADGRVYFTTFTDSDEDDHAVRSVATTCGEQASVVWSGGPHDLFGAGMAVRDGAVYWGQEDLAAGRYGLYRALAGGGDRTQIATFDASQAPSTALIADDAWLYAASDTAIVWFPLASGNPTGVVADEVGAIALHGSTLYYTVPTTGQLTALDPTSMQLSQVGQLAGLSAATFDLDDAVAYVATDDTIGAIPLDGRPAYILAGTAPAQARAIVRGPDALYADLATTTADGGQTDALARIPLVGGPPQILVDGLSYVFSIAIDGDALYAAQCACSSPGKIIRVALPAP